MRSVAAGLALVGSSLLGGACATSHGATLPPCVSPQPRASGTPPAAAVEAGRQYQALVDATDAQRQDLNNRILAHQAAGDIAAVKRDFAEQIANGQDGERRLRQISFPASMSADVVAYFDAIAGARRATQEYIDSPDSGGRDRAIDDINAAGRTEQNVVNQVRADLALPILPCNGP